MPAYKTIPYTQMLTQGQVFTAWAAETPTPGNGGAAASERVALTPNRVTQGAGISITGSFAAPPGAFEIDVEPADVDTEAGYVQVNPVTTVDANNAFHLDLPNFIGGFVRLLLKSRTNAVAVSATIRRG